MMYYNYMVKMFNEIEQEEIISEFLNKINMNDTIRMINKKLGCVKNVNLIIIIFNYIKLNYQKILLNTYANIIIKNVINAKH